MDALTPPKKRKRARSSLNNRHLPSELIEEILLNLPPKSLVRFSAVSNSWNSMIFDPVFARKHKNRAALLRRHRLVVFTEAYLKKVSPVFSLPPTSSDLDIKLIKKRHLSSDGTETTERSFSVFSNAKDIDVRDFSSQFEGVAHLLAYCDELWCVEVKNSFFLWNPSMRNIVQLPPPLFEYAWTSRYVGFFIYGMVYDSVNEDYKILKIERRLPYRTELYSMKNKRWREIKSFSIPHREGDYFSDSNRCEFVEGRFHWLREKIQRAAISIAFFDLSTEKYGEVAPPEYEAGLNITSSNIDSMEVAALRGMLCASQNYYVAREDRFVLWVMEEYGVEKSWTKRLDIPLSSHLLCSRIIPFYLFDNNDVLVKCYEPSTDYMCIFMFRYGEAKPKKMVKCKQSCSFDYKADAFFYVESLITHKNFS